MTAAASSASSGTVPTPRDIAVDVAHRLADPSRVAVALRACGDVGEVPTWTVSAFARGNAGLAFALATIGTAIQDESLTKAATRYLSGALRSIRGATNPPPGLWTGIAGLVVATNAVSRQPGTVLDELIEALEYSLDPLVGASRELGMPVSVFDTISGLAGIVTGLTLLPDQERARRIQTPALAALTDLILDEADPPRWFTPGPMLPGKWMQQAYPGGNMNVGVAHGVAGAISALSICWMHGSRVARQDEAIDRGARWLLEHAGRDAWGLTWPVAVPIGSAMQVYGHGGWCYGASGTAASLRLAGCATGDPTVAAAADQAMDAVLARPAEIRNLRSPGACHGSGGLLQIARVFADAGHLGAKQAIGSLRDEVIACFDPGRPLGYRVLEAEGWVDQPGLLDGVAGIPLSLLDAEGVDLPEWRRVLLLA